MRRIPADKWLGGAVACAAVALAGSAAGSPPPPFAPLFGAWSGTGQVRLENGRNEQIKCKAYYTDRQPGLGLALKCASSGSTIDLRAQMQADGSRLHGEWEERQFNAAGSIVGVASGNKLSMTLDGGGLKAAVSVTTTGTAQTVTIATDAGMVRGAQILLTRDAAP